MKTLWNWIYGWNWNIVIGMNRNVNVFGNLELECWFVNDHGNWNEMVGMNDWIEMVYLHMKWKE